MRPDADELFARAMSPGARPDLQANLHALRNVAPVYHGPGGVWFLTRHQDCLRLLRTPGIVLGLSSEALRADPRWRGGPLLELLCEALLFNDPPQHTRLRQAVQPWFTPRGIERWHEVVDAQVAAALAAVQGVEEFDLMTAYTEPVVNGVIGEVIGMSPEDVAAFIDAHRLITRALGAGASDEAVLAGNRAAGEALAITRRLIADRGPSPRGEDLVSRLLRADAGPALNAAELVSMVDFVFEAGLESSALAIGNAVQALAAHRERLERLRNEPGLRRTAVEELLRFDGPVLTGGQPRIGREPLVFGNTSIPAGELVMPIVAAANHDPAQFDSPDDLVLDREPNHHLTFGAGAHHCLGAHLARLEIQRAVSGLLERCRSIALTGEPVWLEDPPFLRGMTSRPVRVEWTTADARPG